MRLFHSPYSSNARRARMTAVHLDAKVEIVLVDLAKEEQRKAESLQMNPNGKVPVLDDEGNRWIAQDRLTLADFAIASPLMAIGPAQLPVIDRANLMAWFGRVEAVDAWRKTSL